MRSALTFDTNINSDSHSNVNRNTNSLAYPYAYRNANCYPDSNPYGNAHRHSNRHPHTKRNSNRYSHPDSNPSAIAHRTTNGDTRPTHSNTKTNYSAVCSDKHPCADCDSNQNSNCTWSTGISLSNNRPCRADHRTHRGHSGRQH
jgi:hypothetical protein